MVNFSRQGSYADKDFTDKDDEDVLPCCSSGAGVYKSNYDVTDDLNNNCDGQELDDLCDFDDHLSKTDAEVSKFTFLERLAHYMEGERISMSNRKLVEICIMIESERYVRNMDPMKREKQEEIILREYTSIINDIEDHQFKMDSVWAAMLWLYSRGKKQLTSAT